MVIFHNLKPFSVTEMTWGTGHSLRKGTISLSWLTLHMLKLSFVTFIQIIRRSKSQYEGKLHFLLLTNCK